MLFRSVYTSLVDRWILADNSEIPFKVVAEGTKDALFVKDSATYEKIKSLSENDD